MTTTIQKPESALRTWFRQLLCGLRGHDALPNFEAERMSLRCTSCGHETPGWELNEVPPTTTAPTYRPARIGRL